jgi:aspartyl-tRNA synthetase
VVPSSVIAPAGRTRFLPTDAAASAAVARGELEATGARSPIGRRRRMSSTLMARYHTRAMPPTADASPYRTHTCGELRATNAGSEVRLAGWVNRRRDQGGLIFLDLRDRYGVTQVVIDRTDAPAAHQSAIRVRGEFVVSVAGTVAKRIEGTENKRLPTGEVELQATDLTILNEAKTPPFYVNDPDAQIDESLRLKYRYLDLRREPMARRMQLRSQLVHAIREAHQKAGFIDIETPNLIKATPEGARDFLVPSRLQPGNVYALPQSPQQLKQLLMVAGVDRYFQIARCFRDEDLRGDRQPEFTQLDLEMSFVDEAAVMDFVESMIVEVSRAVVPERPLQAVPFPRLTYAEAMDRYGSDKPDVRFAMQLANLAPVLCGEDGKATSGFRVFDETLAAGGVVKSIVASGMGGATRREIDELVEQAKRFGAAGLAHLALEPDGAVKSPIAKFLGEGVAELLATAAGANPGDLVLIVADTADVANDVLGRLRQDLGTRLKLVDENALAYLWVYRFPMYKWDAENERWDATHNPFSGVLPEDEELLTTADGDPTRPSPKDPAGKARAMQYDVVLNGWELGGGSIRIWRRDLLERSFALQGHSLEAMREKFGAMLEAFEFGAPPHGGIAIGIDRWAALFSKQTNIREVMAFPKTQSGTDLMLEAPSAPEAEQLAELGLKFVGVQRKATAGPPREAGPEAVDVDGANPEPLG